MRTTVRLVSLIAIAVFMSGCGERVLYVPMVRPTDGARTNCTVGPFSPATLIEPSDVKSARREFAACVAACRKLGFTETQSLPPLMAGVEIRADPTINESGFCEILKG
jgi:hypothetical protein